MGVILFRDLLAGEMFIFAAERKWSTMVKGPWVKFGGGRSYARVGGGPSFKASPRAVVERILRSRGNPGRTRFREGDRVRYERTPSEIAYATIARAPYALPPDGALGTVTRVPLPGGGRGRMGFFIYVAFDHGSTLGVPERTLSRVPSRRRERR